MAVAVITTARTVAIIAIAVHWLVGPSALPTTQPGRSMHSALRNQKPVPAEKPVAEKPLAEKPVAENESRAGARTSWGTTPLPVPPPAPKVRVTATGEGWQITNLDAFETWQACQAEVGTSTAK